MVTMLGGKGGDDGRYQQGNRDALLVRVKIHRHLAANWFRHE
jgi:hypothetical protein